MSDFANPIAEAQGWIADHLLSDEERIHAEHWETGSEDLDVELGFDRGARIMQALLQLLKPPCPDIVEGLTFDSRCRTCGHLAGSHHWPTRICAECPTSPTTEETP